jgi:hypothetical protein
MTNPNQPKPNAIAAGPVTAATSAAAPSRSEVGKPAGPCNPWETLRVGSRVLAAYWGEKKEFDGFWLATVKRIENGEFTLEWLEAPEYPPFKTNPKNIAVPHPDFRASGK